MSEIPQKDFYKLSEVCQYTDTQPYVLRFWESEFPQLSPRKSGGGQRIYRREDIELVRRIKQLLYEEEYTLAGARQKLEDEGASGKRRQAKTRSKRRGAATDKPTVGPSRPRADAGRESNPVSAKPRTSIPTLPLEPTDVDTVSRTRYEDAIDEIDHLRLQLKEAEKQWRRAEHQLEENRQAMERRRERSEKIAARLEKLLEGLP